MFVLDFEFHSGRRWVHQVRRVRMSTQLDLAKRLNSNVM